ncbi:alpha/beta fold hydrolase [Pedobacter sp. SYSU D00535]|uniref:alpha/beta fold hydrolase n=1 Tax=Pedobacter sp. SYSU D00535 TaxID=2810308 RepID=UPI001A9758D3|nr:alpha/beta hydrolase [Pedobacter sp. SYSU D00535]
MRTSNVIKRNNVSIRGNLASRRTIVFAHGFGTDQQAWRDVLPHFEEDYRLILFDNTGGGKSDLGAYDTRKYASLGGYTSDLIEIALHFDLRRAIFVGHSVSGMVGLIASIARPELFSTQILIGPSARYLNDEGYVGGFEQSDLDGLYQAIQDNYYAWVSGFAKLAMRNDDRPELQRQFAEGLSSLRPDIALAVARSIFQSDFRHILRHIPTKTLLVHAKNDIAVPEEAARFLHQQIKNSKLVFVDAEGHFPHISAAPEVARSIKDFLSTATP